MSELNRRAFLRAGGLGLGAMGLDALGRSDVSSAQTPTGKAKKVLVLFQAGGPSQLETFDPKPGLASLRGTDLPESVRAGRRITTMTSGGPLRVANSLIGFSQHGAAGTWVSHAFPYLASVADELCVIRSMTAEAINHDPAMNLALSGSQLPGRPSLGAWISLALGEGDPRIPRFVTMTSDTKAQFVQPLPKRLWSSEFLPSLHQGISLRPGAKPVLYLNDNTQIPLEKNAELVRAIQKLNEQRHSQVQDPQILQRNGAYEVALAMQQSMAELADLSQESEATFELYGPQSKTAGTFAANCLRARRLLERGVKCVMLMHRGWDHHYTQTDHMNRIAADVDQPTAGLLSDLRRTGLLDETLVVWTGEFGRTAYSQGEITATDHGRDHHPYAFSSFLAGAGVKRGLTYGQTDDFAYTVTENPVHIHDLHATILHLLGVDHTTLTYPHDGRAFRLTDIYGQVAHALLA